MRKKEKWATLFLPIVFLMTSAYIFLDNYWSNISPALYLWHDLCAVKVVLNAAFPLMLSLIGIMLLKTDPPIYYRKILTLYLPASILLCMFFWVSISLTIMDVSDVQEFDSYTLLDSMSSVLDSPFYVGFYQLLVVLFACWPVLRKIAASKKLSGYAALIFFAVGIVNSFISAVPALNKIYLFTSQINWGDFTAFGFYLFIGLYISELNFELYMLAPALSLALISSTAAFVLTVNSATATSYSDLYINIFSPFMAIFAVSLLVSAKILFERFSNNAVCLGFLRSKYCLLFPGFVSLANIVVELTFPFERFHPLLSLAVETILSWFFSMLASLAVCCFVRELRAAWNIRIAKKEASRV